MSKFPQSVKTALWSYDIDSMDIRRDKASIIKQIMDMGSFDATKWMRDTYTHDEIRSIIESTPQSAWRSKKSLNYWKLLFNVDPPMMRSV